MKAKYLINNAIESTSRLAHLNNYENFENIVDPSITTPQIFTSGRVG